MTHATYPHVFSPIRIGPIELRNRFYMSPHSVPMAVGPKPSDDYIHYFVARVKDGGCGLVVLTMTLHGRTRTFQVSPHNRASLGAFRATADAVHEAGGKIFGEPYYQWAVHGQWQPLSPPAPAFGPSSSQYRAQEKSFTTRAMSKRDIALMQGALRQSVEHLREAGFDGVMVHAAHGAIIEQFLSPYFNRRTDEYGGSLENRMRLLRESLHLARDAAGSGMAVGVRFNCNELLPGGYGTDEARQVLKLISDEGLIDYADLDVAVEPQQYPLGMPPVFQPKHLYRPYVDSVRSALGKVPVLSVLGRMTSVASAEAMISEGVCDMVGAARGLIAEPDLVRNAFVGMEDRSRVCIACNWCMAGIHDNSAGCAINPVSYRERIWGRDSFQLAPRKAKVVVVGGGPGGLEAARVSALRGHDVVLVEAQDHLGGNFSRWASLPGREDFKTAIAWWEREIRRLAVDVRLGTRATAQSILQMQPSAVLLATGAIYSPGGRGFHSEEDIPGYDRDFVLRPEELFERQALPRGRVVVLDEEGLHTGMGIAEWLALSGARVEFLTPNALPLSSRLFAAQEARFMMERFRGAGGRISTTAYIMAIGDHQVDIEDTITHARTVLDDVEAVILCTSRLPVNELEPALDGHVDQLFCIGDALAPRVWAAATFEGHKFARYIGEPDAPRVTAEAYFVDDDPWVVPLPGDAIRARTH